MGRFVYQARDGKGDLQTGTINAVTVDEAGKMLRAEGKYIVKLDAAKEKQSDDAGPGGARVGRIKRREVIMFTHQLAVMVDTGVPISDALECAIEHTMDPNFKIVLKDISEHVQSGGEFSGALRKYPKVFPNVMVSLIRASELTGTMGRMLEQVSSYMTKEDQTMRRARGAMLYPIFMMLMAVGVTVFLLTFVLPKFSAIYGDRGAALPAPTRLLLGVSGMMTQYWYAWIGGVVAASIFFWVFRRTQTGRRTFDWLKLNVPIMKKLFRQLYLTRACRTMGTMINAGISMLDMISVVKDVTHNAYFDDLWDGVDERLRQGAQLSEPLFATDLFPRSISQMIYSGERSGRLGEVVTKIADFTEVEFDETVKTTTQFIEPLMISFMGTLIGFVAISLLLPIFSIGRVVSGSG